MHSVRNSLTFRGKIDQISVSLQSLLSEFAPFAPVPQNSLRTLLTIMGPISRIGPFDAEKHAFHFKNTWSFNEHDAAEIRKRFEVPIGGVVNTQLSAILIPLSEIKVTIPNPIPDFIPFISGDIEIHLPDFIINSIISEVKNALLEKLIGVTMNIIPGTFGRCGGMAFAGLDFYLVGWPVDGRFGTTPPESGDLREYIWKRLLDSLDANAGKFIEGIATLYFLPLASKIATVSLSAAAASLLGSPFFGPLALFIGALIGTQVDFFHLGGAGALLNKSRGEWVKLKDRLDNNPAWPIGLIYGDKMNPVDQHQVLATGYTDCGDGTVILKVWDNNDGNKSQDWKFDFRGSELQVVDSPYYIKGLICDDYLLDIPPLSLKLS